MIPNKYFVVRDPDAVIRRVPPGLADSGPLMVDHGTLRPVTPPKVG
jgi:hypothetical protein